MVATDDGDRIHFLDWGGARSAGGPGLLLIHGLSQTAWIWAPVARELAAAAPVAAMDLRGHGLSDAPTEPEVYDLAVLAGDAVAVVDGSGVAAADTGVVLVGHGFGAMVAARAASMLGPACAGLVLVDGGWESLEAALGMDADEFLRGIEEPPEVMRSVRAFLADRRGFDPATWDADQEAAARATVVETHAGRVVPATRPHALEASVRSMFAYDPAGDLSGIEAPIVALIADEDGPQSPESGTAAAGARRRALEAIDAVRVAAGRSPIRVVPFGPVGHNLMRYRPREVVAAIQHVRAAPGPTFETGSDASSGAAPDVVTGTTPD